MRKDYQQFKKNISGGSTELWKSFGEAYLFSDERKKKEHKNSKKRNM